MTQRNALTQREQKAIGDVGRELRSAREAMRLSIREAAERTVTPRGHMSYQTWRRVEMGYTETSQGHLVYKPLAETVMAMAEVVGLDGEAMCKRLRLEPPPQRRPQRRDAELDAIRAELERLAERVSRLAQR